MDRCDKLILKLIGIVIVDLFVGYKVTTAILESENLIKNQNNEIHLWTPLIKTEFWLIFIFGGLGLLALSRLIEINLEYLNRAIDKYNGNLIKQIKSKLHHNELDISQIENEITLNENELNNIESKLNQFKIDSSLLFETQRNRESENEKLYGELIDKISYLSQKYQTDIKMNLPLVTNSIIQQRLSKFRSGWNKRLFSHYNSEVAATYANNYQSTYDQWYSSNFKK